MYKGQTEVKVATAVLEFPNATAAHLTKWTEDEKLDIIDVNITFPSESVCCLVIFYREKG